MTWEQVIKNLASRRRLRQTAEITTFPAFAVYSLYLKVKINILSINILHLRSFQVSFESNSRLPSFCFKTLCDRLKKSRHFSQPIRNKTEPNRGRFPAISAGYKYLLQGLIGWSIVLFASVVTGQSHYFGIGFTTLSLEPLLYETREDK